MDYYYIAADDRTALTAKDLESGPTPGSSFVSVEAKDVMACPHLEQLVAASTGKVHANLVPELRKLWPEPPPPGSELSFEPGTMITRLPDSLRDNVALVEVTQSVAEVWAAELWGFEPTHAAAVAKDIVRVARAARDTGQHLYWWSEM